jgi:hypothetical protein
LESGDHFFGLAVSVLRDGGHSCDFAEDWSYLGGVGVVFSFEGSSLREEGGCLSFELGSCEFSGGVVPACVGAHFDFKRIIL